MGRLARKDQIGGGGEKNCVIEGCQNQPVVGLQSLTSPVMEDLQKQRLLDMETLVEEKEVTIAKDFLKVIKDEKGLIWHRLKKIPKIENRWKDAFICKNHRLEYSTQFNSKTKKKPSCEYPSHSGKISGVRKVTLSNYLLSGEICIIGENICNTCRCRLKKEKGKLA